jgi:hypothetical protein
MCANVVQVQDDSKLLSGPPWHINGNPDNNLEPPCMFLDNHRSQQRSVNEIMEVSCTQLKYKMVYYTLMYYIFPHISTIAAIFRWSVYG